MTIKFSVLNRWSGDVQFTSEIECADDAPASIKLGLAVRWAYRSGADLSGAVLRGADLRDAVLRGADLRGADLSGADLSDAVLSGADLRDAVLRGADLSGADLSGADLSDAVLRGADLRSFKADFWMTLTQFRDEAPALMTALREGHIDGSQYTGECACLVGTIAKIKGVAYETLEHSASHPAELWFMMIKKGDRPGDDTGGGFASQQALYWAEEWCALNGIEAGAAAQTELVP